MFTPLKSAARTRRSSKPWDAVRLVLYLMTPENHEVAGGAGLPSMTRRRSPRSMRGVLAMSEVERARYRDAAIQRVREHYSWDAVTTEYERLFEYLLKGEARA